MTWIFGETTHLGLVDVVEYGPGVGAHEDLDLRVLVSGDVTDVVVVGHVEEVDPGLRLDLHVDCLRRPSTRDRSPCSNRGLCREDST